MAGTGWFQHLYYILPGEEKRKEDAKGSQGYAPGIKESHKLIYVGFSIYDYSLS